MQAFKTRIQLLAEKLGGSLGFEHDGSLVVTLANGRIHFRPSSRDQMQCDITLDGDDFSITAPKSHCFDIIYRFATPHLAQKLRQYTPNLLIELSEYINDEQADGRIADLKRAIADDPSLTSMELGGNRLVAEYNNGYLILTDDLCYGATNVVNF